MAHQKSSDRPSIAERTPLKPKVDDDHVEERRSRPSSPKTHVEKSDKSDSESLSRGVFDRKTDAMNASSSSTSHPPCKEGEASSNSTEENGRERLKRHRVEMAGRVWIPDIWGQEDFLRDWIDCSAFDACLRPSGLMSARASLVEEGRRASSGGLRIENRC